MVGRMVETLMAVGAAVASNMTSQQRILFAKLFFIIAGGGVLMTFGIYQLENYRDWSDRRERDRAAREQRACLEDPACRAKEKADKLKKLRAARAEALATIDAMRKERGASEARSTMQGYWLTRSPQGRVQSLYHISGGSMTYMDADLGTRTVFEVGFAPRGRDVLMVQEDGRHWLLQSPARQRPVQQMTYNREKASAGQPWATLQPATAAEYERAREEALRALPPFVRKFHEPQRYEAVMEKATP